MPDRTDRTGSTRARALLSLWLLVLAAPALGLDQSQRVELADLLAMDDQAPLAEADEAFSEIQSRLFELESELDMARSDYALAAAPVEQAAAELEAAEAELRELVKAGAAPDEIADREDRVHAARRWMEDATAEVEPLHAQSAEAQTAIDDLRQDYWAARRAHAAIKDEIVRTARFVHELDDRRAGALHAAMLEAAQNGWLPLDIDLAALELIAQRDLGRSDIEQLPAAFERARREQRDGVAVFLCSIDDGCSDAPPASDEKR